MKQPKNAHLWARDPDDWYVEPEWCSRRLFDVEKFNGVIHDPSCGMGRIIASARAAEFEVDAGDIVQRTDDIDFMNS